MTDRMPQVTIVYALLLVLLGAIGYYATGQQSVTALIPAFFGIALLICGLIALKEHLMRHAMHAAAMLGLLGIFGTAKGLLKGISMLTGTEMERPAAVISQSVMAVLSVVFVALCINSFIQIRKRREAAADS